MRGGFPPSLQFHGKSQYATWLTHIVRFDFGNSLSSHTPVAHRLKTALPTTLELALLALLISLLIALPVGTLAAVRQDSVPDYIGRSISIGFLSVPSFWLATMIIVYSSVWFTKAMPPYDQIWDSPYHNLKFMLFPFGYFVPVGPASHASGRLCTD